MTMKKPDICERKRNGKTTYYCELNGKQHGLGTDREQAEILFDDLRAKHRARKELTAQVQPSKPALTVKAVLLAFLEWTKKNRAAGTYTFYAQSLVGTAKQSQGFVPFADTIGDVLVADFGAQHVEDWLGRYKDRSNTYRHNLARSVVAAFNWAVKPARKLLKENPLAGMEKPAQTPRKAYIDDSQWDKIMAVVDGNFRDFLEIMRETGCRPQEARVVTAEHFQRENKRWYFPDPPKKVPGEKEPRIVYLNDCAFEICQRLALKNPTGPLFQNDDGTAWQKNTLTARCARLKKKLGFGFCVYGVRHAWCTAALKRGVDPLTVATLMGHRDATMIMKVYQKLGKCDDHLKAALRKATEAPAA